VAGVVAQLDELPGVCDDVALLALSVPAAAPVPG
jgi:hypothetical protein